MPSASVLQATKKTRTLAWRALNASAPTTVARLAARTDEILAGLDDLNCVSRLWVLSSVVGATCGGPMNVFSKVVARFTAEACACRSRQTPRMIHGVIGVVDAVDPSAAQALLNLFVSPQVASARNASSNGSERFP